MHKPQRLKSDKALSILSTRGASQWSTKPSPLKKYRGNQGNEIESEGVLRIEISCEKITALLKQRLLCAADIHCLDACSKQCLHKLCLKTCLRSEQNKGSANLQLDYEGTAL